MKEARKRFFVCLALVLMPLLFLRAQTVGAEKIASWKKSLEGPEYESLANVLNFPSGIVSQATWKAQITDPVGKESLRIRKALVMIIGQKHLYPSLSIPALIGLLNDSSESIARTALFSLAAFGTAAIEPLFATIEKNAKPYVSYMNGSTPYEEASKEEFFIPEWYYSRSAMRAMFGLRLLYDGVFEAYKRHPGIKNYYKAYILQGIGITSKNFDDYYLEVRKVEKLFKDYIPDYCLRKLVYEKLQNSFSLEEGMRLLEKADRKAVPSYKSFIKDQDNGQTPASMGDFLVRETEQLEVDSTWPHLRAPRTRSWIEFTRRLNSVSLHRQRFPAIRDSLEAVLKTGAYEGEMLADGDLKMLLVLTGNIGDSAKSLDSFVFPFLQHANPDVRYLAYKAALNLRMESNGCSVICPPKLLLPPPAESPYGQERLLDAYGYNRFYLDFSNELYEAMPSVNGYAARMDYFAWLGDDWDHHYPLNKVTLNADHQIVKGNVRTLSNMDTTTLRLILYGSRDRDKRMRLYTAYVLGMTDTLPDALLPEVKKLLTDEDRSVKNTMCLNAARLNLKDREAEKYITIVLVNAYISERMEVERNEILYGLDVAPFVFDKGGGGPGMPALTSIPQPSYYTTIACRNGSAPSKLGGIFSLLKSNLHASGMDDVRAYAYSDGFALFTRMERLKEDGAVDVKHRWVKGKLKPGSVSEYFAQLFYGDQGFFRTAAVIACTNRSLSPFARGFHSSEDYERLFSGGSAQLTTEINEAPTVRTTLHLVVYEFEKASDGTIRFKKDRDGTTIGDHFKSLRLTSFNLQ